MLETELLDLVDDDEVICLQGVSVKIRTNLTNWTVYTWTEVFDRYHIWASRVLLMGHEPLGPRGYVLRFVQELGKRKVRKQNDLQHLQALLGYFKKSMLDEFFQAGAIYVEENRDVLLMSAQALARRQRENHH